MGRRGSAAISEFAGMLGHLASFCFNSEAIGVMAIGALKDDVRRKPGEVIADLEAQLKEVKTLGLRNTIRLTLKDVYKHQGEDEKVLQQLRALIAENDKALQAEKKK